MLGGSSIALGGVRPSPGVGGYTRKTNIGSHISGSGLPQGLVDAILGHAGGGSGGAGGSGGSGDGSGGSSPYGDLGNDPGYQQALADERAALAAAGARRDASTNQALINFGAVPDFASVGHALGLTPDQINAITGGINTETGTLASQYTKSGDSVLGQLNHAHDVALSQLRASLAARGMLESGATGVGAGQANDSYQHGLSSAYQTLLGNLLGYQDNYANASNSARSALEAAASSAYDRNVQQAQQNPDLYGGGGGGGSAPPPGGGVTPTGPGSFAISSRPTPAMAPFQNLLLHPPAPMQPNSHRPGVQI